MKQIDTRGLSCPEPVIRATRAVNAMNQREQLEILVETGAARDNVLRALQSWFLLIASTRSFRPRIMPA